MDNGNPNPRAHLQQHEHQRHHPSPQQRSVPQHPPSPQHHLPHHRLQPQHRTSDLLHHPHFNNSRKRIRTDDASPFHLSHPDEPPKASRMTDPPPSDLIITPNPVAEAEAEAAAATAAATASAASNPNTTSNATPLPSNSPTQAPSSTNTLQPLHPPITNLIAMSQTVPSNSRPPSNLSSHPNIPNDHQQHQQQQHQQQQHQQQQQQHMQQQHQQHQHQHQHQQHQQQHHQHHQQHHHQQLNPSQQQQHTPGPMYNMALPLPNPGRAHRFCQACDHVNHVRRKLCIKCGAPKPSAVRNAVGVGVRSVQDSDNSQQDRRPSSSNDIQSLSMNTALSQPSMSPTSLPQPAPSGTGLMSLYGRTISPSTSLNENNNVSNNSRPSSNTIINATSSNDVNSSGNMGVVMLGRPGTSSLFHDHPVNSSAVTPSTSAFSSFRPQPDAFSQHQLHHQQSQNQFQNQNNRQHEPHSQQSHQQLEQAQSHPLSMNKPGDDIPLLNVTEPNQSANQPVQSRSSLPRQTVLAEPLVNPSQLPSSNMPSSLTFPSKNYYSLDRSSIGSNINNQEQISLPSVHRAQLSQQQQHQSIFNSVGGNSGTTRMGVNSSNDGGTRGTVLHQQGLGSSNPNTGVSSVGNVFGAERMNQMRQSQQHNFNNNPPNRGNIHGSAISGGIGRYNNQQSEGHHRPQAHLSNQPNLLSANVTTTANAPPSFGEGSMMDGGDSQNLFSAQNQTYFPNPTSNPLRTAGLISSSIPGVGSTGMLSSGTSNNSAGIGLGVGSTLGVGPHAGLLQHSRQDGRATGSAGGSGRPPSGSNLTNSDSSGQLAGATPGIGGSLSVIEAIGNGRMISGNNKNPAGKESANGDNLIINRGHDAASINNGGNMHNGDNLNGRDNGAVPSNIKNVSGNDVEITENTEPKQVGNAGSGSKRIDGGPNCSEGGVGMMHVGVAATSSDAADGAGDGEGEVGSRILDGDKSSVTGASGGGSVEGNTHLEDGGRGGSDEGRYAIGSILMPEKSCGRRPEASDQPQ